MWTLKQGKKCIIYNDARASTKRENISLSFMLLITEGGRKEMPCYIRLWSMVCAPVCLRPIKVSRIDVEVWYDILPLHVLLTCLSQWVYPHNELGVAQHHLWHLLAWNCNSHDLEQERRLKQKASALVLRAGSIKVFHVLSKLLGSWLPRGHGWVRNVLYSSTSLRASIFSLSFGVLSKIGQVES